MTFAQGWRRTARWALWALVFAAVGTVAWRNRESLQEVPGHIARASGPWLLAALGAVALLYLLRAAVYRIPLRLMGYSVPWPVLWGAAVLSSAVNQLLPTGGASTYAVLTWALTRRGVRGGQASLVALIDTLSYALATATLVIGALCWAGAAGALRGPALILGFAPGSALVAVGVWIYWLQRKRARFVRHVLRLERWLTQRFGVRSRARQIRAFLDDFYQGKAVLARHPGAFVWMIALQYLVVVADTGILYFTFLALGVAAPLSLVFLGFVVAMAAGTVVSAPAGGGSFEVVMSAFFIRQGLGRTDAITAAMLFRVVSFWVPLVASGLLVLGFRRGNVKRAIRRQATAA